jgi:hypothetical protein
MKKLISFASMFALAAALSVGCKKNEEAKPAEPTPAPEAAKPADMVKPAEATAPTAPAGDTVAAATGVAECDSYVATLEKYSKCDKIEAAAKEATLKGADAIKASFASLKDPAVTPEVKKAAADGCKSAEDAVKTAWTAAGCS